MNSPKYDLKIFLDTMSQVDLAEFIPVFHGWIQTQALAELLIDVADYRHVHHGPGVVLIAHDAHYAMDTATGRPGLLYSRRRETHPSRRTPQNVAARLRSILHCALTACQQLEADPALHGRLQFRGDTLQLRYNDRLPVASASAAYEALQQHLRPCLTLLYPGQRLEVTPLHSRDARLTITVSAVENPDVSTLLARLSSANAGSLVGPR
jgi:hypothetical protein